MKLFEVIHWFYFVVTTFGALLFWNATFLFWQGHYSGKIPQAPSEVAIAQLILIFVTLGSEARFQSFDGDST